MSRVAACCAIPGGVVTAKPPCAFTTWRWLVWRGKGWMKNSEQEFALLPGFCALMRPGGIYDAGHDEANPLAITFLAETDLRIGEIAERLGYADVFFSRQFKEKTGITPTDFRTKTFLRRGD